MHASLRCVTFPPNCCAPSRSAPAHGEAIRWLEVPDPAREVGVVLRHVKRLLLDGCAPDDILIALRDWTLYGGQFAAQGQAYDLPLALHYGEPLASNPAVVALLDLLRLHLGDFRRRDLLDVLRSPYFAVPGLDAWLIGRLERLSLEMRITGGRAAWLEAVDWLALPGDAAQDRRGRRDARAAPRSCACRAAEDGAHRFLRRRDAAGARQRRRVRRLAGNADRAGHRRP